MIRITLLISSFYWFWILIYLLAVSAICLAGKLSWHLQFFYWLKLVDFDFLIMKPKIIYWCCRIQMLNLRSTGTAWLLRVCLDLVLLDQLGTSGMWILFCSVYLPAFQYFLLIKSCLHMAEFLLISYNVIHL